MLDEPLPLGGVWIVIGTASTVGSPFREVSIGRLLVEDLLFRVIVTLELKRDNGQGRAGHYGEIDHGYFFFW